MTTHRVEMQLGGRTLSIETGKIAKQADGAVFVQYGETVVLGPVRASTFSPSPSTTAKSSAPRASSPAASANAKARRTKKKS
jgi:hypothetical protein